MRATAPVVLLVDDTADDIFMFRWALLRAQLSCDLRTLNDGREAVDYLSGSGMFAERSEYPFPVATVLDCQLPTFSGLAVLSWARKQPHLKNHPMIMLTGSAREFEELQAQKFGATRYFEKSSHYREVVEFLRQYLPPSQAAKAA